VGERKNDKTILDRSRVFVREVEVEDDFVRGWNCEEGKASVGVGGYEEEDSSDEEGLSRLERALLSLVVEVLLLRWASSPAGVTLKILAIVKL
jgi:hypothetical protein